jgi:hypothetical protein
MLGLEIKIAINFLLSFLYSKIPRRRLEAFKGQLYKNIYNLHMHLNSPFIHPDLKLIIINLNNKSKKLTTKIDLSLLHAARYSCIDIYEILECFPQSFSLYLEINYVYYIVWNKNQDKHIIYDNRHTHNNLITSEFNILNNIHRANKNNTTLSLVSKNMIYTSMPNTIIQTTNSSNSFISFTNPPGFYLNSSYYNIFDSFDHHNHNIIHYYSINNNQNSNINNNTGLRSLHELEKIFKDLIFEKYCLKCIAV